LKRIFFQKGGKNFCAFFPIMVKKRVIKKQSRALPVLPPKPVPAETSKKKKKKKKKKGRVVRRRFLSRSFTCDNVVGFALRFFFFFHTKGTKKGAGKNELVESPEDDGARESLDSAGKPKDTDYVDIVPSSVRKAIAASSVLSVAPLSPVSIERQLAEKPRAVKSSISIDQIATVLDIIVHASCSLFSTKHGSKQSCRNKAVAELLLKGIVVTSDFLYMKVND
jgi:hypothetical protein